MKKVLILFLIISLPTKGQEIFVNDQGISVEYIKPDVSCIYDKEAYEGYLNTCLMLPKYELCAQTKYENYICGDKNMVQKLEKKQTERNKK
tara:strand:+ start:1865 stop:2137 length:273 start_codon:yes stop_codon:yes gene_type:complete